MENIKYSAKTCLFLKLKYLRIRSRTNTTPTLKCSPVIGLLLYISTFFTSLSIFQKYLVKFWVPWWGFFKRYGAPFGVCHSNFLNLFFMSEKTLLTRSIFTLPTQIIHQNRSVFVGCQKMWLSLLWELHISGKSSESNKVYPLSIAIQWKCYSKSLLEVSNRTSFRIVILPKPCDV